MDAPVAKPAGMGPRPVRRRRIMYYRAVGLRRAEAPKRSGTGTTVNEEIGDLGGDLRIGMTLWITKGRC